ncbi:MAG: slipin family protein [Candidatus Dadabacteria bacterium]|nr:slipin family protein [Candidatus Dadabacteria bacterium]MYA48813.1 slipin family protein [Candidatus Dadabacteria bacterium]MYF47469.1 slipin family protein [Candidatus Dadabacteria bacterium]MYG82333.1 slipin family protein [Candidatus Dadabacteria bacterium]MYK49852.1 slipin family protein [Candidatus Dadabacteria bacterium]
MTAIIVLVIVFLIIISGLKILYEYERGVIFRLGRIVGVRGPGFIVVIPFLERMVRVSLRLVTMDVPPQDVITKDNVSVKVNAVVYFRVVEPNRAILQVENYLYATSQLAQTTLRSILGQVELDELLSEREKLNVKLQEVLDKQTDAWGIKVTMVEVKYVDLPQEMQRAMAKQAEAERERRAKVISAEGEFQASTKIAEASEILSANPVSLQLRFLQTINDVSSEKASTIILPLPIDMLSAFTKKDEKTDS